jgi:DNA-directed RNA polymerase subunit RPC12/RpoP
MLVDLDEVLVNYALERGFVSPAEIEDCRREQKAEERAGRQYYIGQILIQRRILSCEQFLEIENALEQKIYECAGCKTRYARKELTQGALDCRGCGARIVVQGGGRLSMAEILASRDPRDLTISMVAEETLLKIDPSQRKRGQRSSERSRRQARRRVSRAALEVDSADLE